MAGYEPEVSMGPKNRIDAIPPRLPEEVHMDYDSDDGYSSCFVIPLIQVFSVCISTHIDEPCEIYGSIQALEGPDHRFDLYKRGPEDSETIHKNRTLSLIGPDDGVIPPLFDTTLDIRLKDKINGIDVVKEKLILDPMNEDSYDRLLKRVVEGPRAVASVYYVVFKFARFGIVQVILTKNGDDDKKCCNAAEIYGSVVARYENGRKYCRDDEEVKLLETRIFDKPQSQPLRVLVGTPIRLSRNMLVVPAYSSLAVEVNLWGPKGEIASDCLFYPVHKCGQFSRYFKAQYACVEVRVQWPRFNTFSHRYLEMQDSQKAKFSKEGKEVQKKAMVLHDQHLSESSVPRTKPKIYYGGDRAEVFSVFVDGVYEKIGALCGTICIDVGTMLSIYERNESSSELLQDHSLASIEFNYKAVRNCDLDIVLNLRDPVRNLEVCRGVVNCYLLSIGSMYNKRLCSVVRGEHGYAAVHYIVFTNALEALVEVKLFAKGRDPDIPVSLYGTLTARYSGYDYSTSYEKKYFVSRLFDRPRDKSLELKTGSNLEMLKSIVVVPAGSSLIIEANLGVSGIDKVDERVRGMEGFEITLSPKISKIPKKIGGEDYWIEVYVKFGCKVGCLSI